MKNKLLVAFTLISAGYILPVSAQMPDVPAMPVPPSANTESSVPAAPPRLPSAPVFDPMTPFDPTAPFSAQPIVPLEAQQIPTPTVPQQRGASDLPIPSDEDFEFFQPGLQLGDYEPEEVAPEPEVVVEIAPPEPDDSKKKKLPLVRFNYKNQHLPETIYKKTYDGLNKHLPVAQHEGDYDRLAFAAAAANNLSGVRALLDAGRDIEMRNEHGETLVMIATRHGSHDVLRYLLNKGADPYGATQTAIQRQDGQAYYALKSVE